MKINNLILILGLVFSVFIFGQGESNNWYFGENAGITFNADGTTVNPLINGQVNTIEGCATISNSTGELLFYTDGVTVYDQNHNIMPNGTGLFGQVSSTQSAVIVPWPGNPNLYYIFTSNHRDPGFSYPNQGVHYSVVDITLNSGNGDITTKNTLLRNATAEKIAAVVKDCTAESLWIVTLGTDDSPLIQPSRRNNLNTYHAFEITAAGVNATSVQSPSPNINIDRDGAEGYLKFSPDGTKMASANMDRGLFIYDFDATTGVISNEQLISTGGTNLHTYGVEFSPNGRYLYAHSSSARPIFRTSSLFQFDLQAGDISNSRVNLDAVHDNFDLTRGALQLGPDGKIYRALQQGFNISGNALGTPYLGVINNPDIGGSGANYLHNGIELDGRNSFQGLPPAVISFFNTIDLIPDGIGRVVADYEVCEGQPLMLETQYIPGATYEWRNGNGDVVTDGDADPHIHNITAATTADGGNYLVTITKPNAQACPITGTLDVIIRPLPITNGNSLFVCDSNANTTDGIDTIDLTQLEDAANFNYTYFETIGDRDTNTNAIGDPTNYTNTTSSQTIYYNAESTSTGCSNSAELQLELGTIAPFTLDSSYFICAGNPTVTINGPPGYDSYQWIRISDGQVLSTNTDIDLSDVGDYRLETSMNYTVGENIYSCMTDAIFSVLQSSLNAADITPNGITPTGGSFTICQNQSLSLETTSIAGGMYQWSKDGVALTTTGNIHQITSTAIADAGDYEVIVTDPAAASCPVTATLTIVIDATVTNASLTMQTCDTDIDNPNDGFTNMDLTAIEDPALTYTYFETIADRTTGIAIADPTNYRNNTFAYTPTVYFSTINSLGCEGLGELQITVNTVAPLTLDRDYWLCPESPTASVSGPNGYDTYQWFRIDATGRQLFATGQTAQFSAVGSFILEAGINFTNNGETISCSSSTEIEILSSSLSVADLIPNNSPVTGGSYTVCEGQPLELRTDEYAGATYTWEKDNVLIANPNSHILLIDTTSASDAGNYLVTVTGQGSLTCPIRGTIDIVVDPTFVLSNPTILSCDTDIDNLNDGLTQLDLTQVATDANFSYFYYETEENRNVNSFIQNPESYRNTTAFNQTLYVKAVNAQGCETFAEIQVQVQTVPEIVLEDSYRICSSSSDLIIEGPDGFNSYKWYRLEGSSDQLLFEGQDFAVSEFGDYMLEVTIDYSSNGQTVSCMSMAFFNVEQSETATIDNVIIEGNTLDNTIEIIASGNGDYEYSIDGISFQDSNFFGNIPSGETTVYVNDKNGCGISEETIDIELDLDLFGFPKFFTPNADGTNDFWQYMPPPSGDDIDLKMIYIYNRYGNLLAQIDPDSPGWDGSSNGRTLPASDYWFRALTNGQEEFRGHFSLKR